MKISDLVLGQKVNLFNGPFGWGMVENITDEEVIITRPYIHITDFSMSNGSGGSKVISYTGLENVKLWKGDSREVNVSVEKPPTIR